MSAATLLTAIVTLIGPSESFATANQGGCITAGGPGVDTCPAGSPHIGSADVSQGLGATASGSVYSELSNSQIAGVSGLPLAAPIVGIAGDGANGPYWLVGSDGGVFAFGGAPYLGSMGGHPLNRPIVGMAADGGKDGYWLVASDGGIFAFGNAGFHGSMGGTPLDAPIVGMATTLDDNGYWLVASDGGIFAFGDANFYGSRGGQPLNGAIVGMAATADNRGYWLASSDGGIFTYGDAPFYGADVGLGFPVIGIADFIANCPPVISIDCPERYGIALSNGQVYINGP